MRIFIAFAGEQEDLAESIFRKLLSAGYKPRHLFWASRNIRGSAGYDKIIRTEIDRADHMLFLASPAALAPRCYTHTELKLFKKRWPDPTGRLLTILLGGVTPAQLPAYPRTVSAISPKGSIDSDVVAEVEQLWPPPRLSPLMRAVVVAASIAVVVGAGKYIYDHLPKPIPEPLRVTIDSPTANAVVDGRGMSVRGTISGGHAGVTLDVHDRKDVKPDGRRFHVNLTPPDTPKFVLEATLSGPGLERASDRVEVVVDHANPIIEVKLPAGGSIVTDKPSYKIVIHVSDDVELRQVTVGEANPLVLSQKSKTIERTIRLEEGDSTTITLRAVDVLGKEAVETIQLERPASRWRALITSAEQAADADDWERARTFHDAAVNAEIPPDQIPKDLTAGLGNPRFKEIEVSSNGLVVTVQATLADLRKTDVVRVEGRDAKRTRHTGSESVWKAAVQFDAEGQHSVRITVEDRGRLRAEKKRMVTLRELDYLLSLEQAKLAAINNDWDAVEALLRQVEGKAPDGFHIPTELTAGVAAWKRPPDLQVDVPADGAVVTGQLRIHGVLVEGFESDEIWMGKDRLRVGLGEFDTVVKSPKTGEQLLRLVVKRGSRTFPQAPIRITVKVATPQWARERMAREQLHAAEARGWTGGFERRTSKEPGDVMRFVFIPAGPFRMGAPQAEASQMQDRPEQIVRMAEPFYVMTTEVTLQQFRSYFKGHQMFLSEKWDDKRQWTGGDYPVNNVTAKMAEQFAVLLTEAERKGEGKYVFRLPTEAEWEHAARCGQRTKYPWGDDPDMLRVTVFANGPDQTMLKYWQEPKNNRRIRGDLSKEDMLPGEDGFVTFAPVGRLMRNAWGLHDMLGNVAEWCREFDGSIANPANPPSGGYLTRGGSCFRETGWYTQAVRPAARMLVTDQYVSGGKRVSRVKLDRTGFRLVAIPRK